MVGLMVGLILSAKRRLRGWRHRRRRRTSVDGSEIVEIALHRVVRRLCALRVPAAARATGSRLGGSTTARTAAGCAVGGGSLHPSCVAGLRVDLDDARGRLCERSAQRSMSGGEGRWRDARGGVFETTRRAYRLAHLATCRLRAPTHLKRPSRQSHCASSGSSGHRTADQLIGRSVVCIPRGPKVGRMEVGGSHNSAVALAAGERLDA